MALIRVFLLIATFFVMVVGSAISLLTYSWWRLALLVILGWIPVVLLGRINRKDSSPDSNDTGSGCGKTKR